MSSTLKVISQVLKIILLVLTLARDSKLRREGAAEVETKLAKKAEAQEEAADAIDLKVNTTGLSPDELARMQHYRREDR